jgi:hypothetical protein
MAQVRGRKANSSVGAAIVLMLLIAVFAATLLYLMTSPVMSLALDPNSPGNPFQTGEDQPPITKQPRWVKGPWSMEQAINDLKANGCTIIENTDKDGLDNANEVNYEGFRTLAMRRRIVYLIANNDTETLLLRMEDNYYVWTPQES